MSRVFFITSRPYCGLSGGGAGVNYKLYLANEKYHLFNDAIFVFNDLILEPNKRYSINDLTPNASYLNAGIRRKCFPRRVINLIPIFRILRDQIKLNSIKNRIKEIDREYGFNEKDAYIFQDIESALAFILLFKFSKTGIVYHQQGSLYHEWNAVNQINSHIYRRYLDHITQMVFSDIGKKAFPSIGAKDVLMQDIPNIMKDINNNDVDIVYNGVDETDLNSFQNIECNCKHKIDKDYINIITIATLNYAKGVERIPEFLKGIRDGGLKIKWYLVGDGIMNDTVEKEVKKNGLDYDFIWLKSHIKHDELMKLLSKMDLFVCLHRWSVFDFAIVEAMACGVIPILSKVGGNKEMIEDGITGFLVDMDRIIDSQRKIINIIQKCGINSMKEKCKERQRIYFSEKAFIDGYCRYYHSVNNISEKSFS